MRRKMRRSWRRKTAAIATAILTVSFGGVSHAMPQGEAVRSGEATIQRSADNKNMDVNQSTKRVAIDWSNFDIANDERVNFRQPDADSIALNRVTGDAKSVIDGQLSGNGRVYVINPNGVLFGKNASVDVGSLVASTAKVSDAAMAGFGSSTGDVALSIDDANAKAAVINEGRIKAEGGLVALHAAVVENAGTITSNGGKIALAAAKNISLAADTAGKLNFTVDGMLAKASTLNSGVLKSDGGYVVMTAKQAGDVMSTVVNNTGTIEAKTLRQDEKGEILLDGGDAGIVEIDGTLDASGMEAGQSAGTIKAIGAETHVEDGATLHAIGAVDGGLIETSGDYLEISNKADIDAAGKTGKSGEWLLDPLEVIISETKPSDATESVSPTVSQDGNENKKSWISSTQIGNILSAGTDVTVEAQDVNKAAAITVGSAITKSVPAADVVVQKQDPTLTLKAQSNITINGNITAADGAGALNVVLHSDTDGNGIGAVSVNADIKTNGGSFTSGSGTDYTTGTVGTYFGQNGSEKNRTIETDGGAVNLYGDVAIGLDGGTLTINTKKADGSAAGKVLVTGTIDSGNAYDLYTVEDTGTWDKLVQQVKDNRKKSNASYTESDWDRELETYYNTVRNNWYKLALELIGEGRNSAKQAPDFSKLTVTQKETLERLYVANSWEDAKVLAETGSRGNGDTVGDSYLATITTALENSLVSQGREYPLFVGGKGSGNLTQAHPAPADPEHTDGYYWVTGPEGLANDGEGTKFAEKDGTPLNNFYANWSTGGTNVGGGKTIEPSNSGPYVSVGYGYSSLWDDVDSAAETTRGFVKETNLEHSALDIQAGSGNVELQGNVGFSVPLSSFKVDTTGEVKVGGGKTSSGTVAGTAYTGQIRTDYDVDIKGGAVNIGDLIQSSEGNVSIMSAGDNGIINVNGIDANGKIKLVAEGDRAQISLNHAYNDGSLVSGSGDNDAVVIDLKGKNASFKNDTNQSNPAIITGTDGGWKIYAYSPKSGDFGTNLNSGTNAQWHTTSSTYLAGKHAGNKYIFQVQPIITVKAAAMTKVYGETMQSDDVTTTSSATFVGQDGKPYDVNAPEYANMFNEGELTQYYKLDTPFSSEGFKMKATRDGGIDHTAVYEIKADQEGDGLSDLGRNSGYAPVEVEGGTVKILKRRIDVNGSGSQTYGDSTIRNWKLTAELTDKQAGLTEPAIVEGDRLDDSTGILAIKSDSDYAKIRDSKIGSQTADASSTPYKDAVDMTKVGFEGNAGVNYEIVTRQGALAVDKAALHIHTGDIYTTYGTVKTATSTVDGLVNGDALADLAIGYGNYGGAYLDNNTRTNVPGQYAFHALYANPDFLKNYVVTNDDATVRIDMAQRKPDINPHEPSNTSGTASYTSNLGGRQGVPGVDRVAGLTDAQLPFFRVESGKVTQYGTYDVTETPSEVRLQPTGKRLPEPNQPKTQYREYTKTLTTVDGSGQFLMTYDGSTFHIEPTDGAALALVRAGDAKHNVDLSAKALHVGFSEMGLVLESLDAVYVCLDGHSQTGSDELA